MTALLASVRDVSEADLVIAAGCDWLDLKEPRDGALGAVPLHVVREVLARHRGRIPISATIGDCWSAPAIIPARVAALAAEGIEYVKVGLFARDLGEVFAAALTEAVRRTPHLIAVCFAEDPPDATAIARLAALGLRGVMLDTADKARGSLTTLLGPARIAEFAQAARRQDLLVGLAGSLRARDVPALLRYDADYLGFRGALCHRGARVDTIDPDAVREIRALLAPRVPQPVALQ